MAFSYMELWSFKVVKLDVCESLVLSNLVTFSLFRSSTSLRLFNVHVKNVFAD